MNSSFASFSLSGIGIGGHGGAHLISAPPFQTWGAFVAFGFGSAGGVALKTFFCTGIVTYPLIDPYDLVFHPNTLSLVSQIRVWILQHPAHDEISGAFVLLVQLPGQNSI